MFARITGAALGLLLALTLTAKTNPDAKVLHPDQWPIVGAQAAQLQDATPKR